MHDRRTEGFPDGGGDHLNVERFQGAQILNRRGFDPLRGGLLGRRHAAGKKPGAYFSRDTSWRARFTAAPYMNPVA